MSELNGARFNEDYFERGVELQISGYQNYRWIPELTIPMALTIIEYLDISRLDTILDYGCAKGYLVKALRLLYRMAWGVDVSSYAIENVDPMVKDYCFLKGNQNLPDSFDLCIAKDVFEHIDEGRLGHSLQRLGAKILFAVIPLGDGEKFIAPSNNIDITHRICQTKDWWIDFFGENGWVTHDFRYKINGIKDHYYERYPEGHGFFVLSR